MRLTHEEAKQKICVKPKGGMCFGSSCMAWRWTTRNNIDNKNNPMAMEEGTRPSWLPSDYVFVPFSKAKAEGGITSYWIEPAKGYCGLAGELYGKS